ncbi:MAG: hypothetical protein LBS84_12115 [Clostridiales bacterium]|jgi:hypothetical protein|nr:hypothetical protein [Clostridiales bacterium]
MKNFITSAAIVFILSFSFPQYALAKEINTNLNVVTPTLVTMNIDPFNMRDKGQIYSERYVFENRGENDVALTFTPSEIEFADDAGVYPLSIPFTDSGELKDSELKAVYITLNFDREDCEPILLTDNIMDEQTIILKASRFNENGNFMELSEDSQLTIWFSGDMNEMTLTEWDSDDIKLQIYYNLLSIDRENTVELDSISRLAETDSYEITSDSSLQHEVIDDSGEKITGKYENVSSDTNNVSANNDSDTILPHKFFSDLSDADNTSGGSLEASPPAITRESGAET